MYTDNKITVYCPCCGLPRAVSPRHAKKAGLCRSCNMKQTQKLGYAATATLMAEIGREGFKACAQKYGAGFLIERVRAHLLKDPSKPEQVVLEVLSHLGINDFEREYHLKTKGSKPRNYLVDFMIWNGVDFVAVEINGTYVHQFHAKRDARKLRLLKRRNYRVLVYTDEQVFSPEFPEQFARDLYQQEGG